MKFGTHVIPWLMTTATALLAWIGITLFGISQTLSVAVSNIASHEKRLDDIDQHNSRQDSALNDHDRRITVLEFRRK